ncbi:hypothetical protein EAF04_009317 [Stromatinia cepivora]|nr:hypothetical protein EAF04_009317 [Stromatinia cepivora]
MFSKLFSKLARILDTNKAQEAKYEQLNNSEEEHQFNSSNGTEKDTHRSSQTHDKSNTALFLEENEQKAKTPHHETLRRENITTDELPSYSSSQNPNSSYSHQYQNQEQQQDQRIHENDEPPSYPLPRNSTLTFERQHVETLIEKRKAEIRLLEEQLEGKRGGGFSSADVISRESGEGVKEVEQMEQAKQAETAKQAAEQAKQVEQVKQAEQAKQAKQAKQAEQAKQTDLEYYIQMCNESRDLMRKDLRILMESKNKKEEKQNNNGEKKWWTTKWP